MAATPDYKRHAGLVDRMATTLGFDLEDWVRQGALNIDAVGDMVLKCTGCGDVDGCERWLAAQKGRADSPPGMCQNTEFFKELKDGGHR